MERGAEFALKKACKSFPETTLRTKFLCQKTLAPRRLRKPMKMRTFFT